MKPYKNITSKNLGILLFIARALIILGAILPILLIPLSYVYFIGAPGLFSVTSFYISFLPVTIFVVSLLISLFIISGILAAIVSFEENYRRRTEAYIQNLDNKI